MTIGRSLTYAMCQTSLVAGFLLTALCVFGQEGHILKGKMIQATAMGTSTQLGENFSLNIHIYKVSTAEERQALVESFAAKGNEGLVNALSKMESKGRLSIPRAVGYDVNFVREVHNKDGSFSVRMVTDRPITMGELWYSTRSRDYSLSALEITFKKDKNGKWKGKGTLAPACEFKLDKDKQLVIEMRMNAWNLTNIQIR